MEGCSTMARSYIINGSIATGVIFLEIPMHKDADIATGVRTLEIPYIALLRSPNSRE